ncbi:aspartate aminotransferase family protein [soil metagenome]
MISQRQLFLNHLAQTTDFPLMIEIERAEGIYMFDSKGKKYIDLISGIGVSNVGHRHPEVLKAIREQMEKYLHLMVYGEFVQSPQTMLAKALADTLTPALKVAYLVNSGSEAVEGALKLAKRFTGRTELISCFNAYHGSSHGALSVGGSEEFKRGYRPLLPGIRHINFGLEADLEQINETTAAVIIEPVQGEAGVRVAEADYFKALELRCKDNGVLLIMDEIQTGFGRTGKFWAFQHYDIQPDIVICAKGMGGGMPIGAFISSSEIMGVLKNNPILGHITTFGGHPLSAAASLATLQVLQTENLVEEAENKAEIFKQHLQHTRIREIRNKGLLMAVDFGSFEELKPIIDKAIQMGVVTDWFLFCNNSMRIAPPLTIQEHEIIEACKLLRAAMS